MESGHTQGEVVLSTFIGTVLLGLLAGAVYGLFSVGLSLVFGVMKLVNFAYGDFVTLGMLIVYQFTVITKVNGYYSFPVVIICMSLLAVVAYFLCFAGRSGRRATGFDQLVATVALSAIIETLVQDGFGDNAKTLPGQSNSTINLWGTFLPVPQVVAFFLTLVLVVLFEIVLVKTSIGRSVRAIVADREVAEMHGINAKRLALLCFTLSCVLAGLAGYMLVQYYPVDATAGQTFLIIGFVCVLVGGLGDTRGAFITGLVIGAVESISAVYWSVGLADVPVYAIFILATIIRPNGLLGRSVAE